MLSSIFITELNFNKRYTYFYEKYLQNYLG
jgi:hypothetical protein